MRSLRLLLFPFALIYYVVISVRNLLYDLGIFKTYSFPVKIISVGNISAGGTGKTPLAEFIIEYLLKRNNSIAFLSRGYKRKKKGFKMYDVRGKNEIGDEPTQIANKFSSITIAVDEDRVHGVENLLNQHNTSNITHHTVVLDDAFQHRRLKRDLDIVTIDATFPPWKDYLLPAGNLREPQFALERADAIVVTKISSEKEKKKIENRLRWVKCPVFFAKYKMEKVIPFSKNITTDYTDITQIKNKKVILVSGIANPKNFHDSIAKENIKVVHPFSFPDHYTFTEKDFQMIEKKFSSGGAEIILFTEKDYSRVAGEEFLKRFEHLPLFYVPIKIEFTERGDEFLRIIDRACDLEK